MQRIIVTAQVQDYAKWEKGFRTHGELLRTMSSSRTVRFGTTGDNTVAVYSEVEDVAKYMEILKSDATAQAMASDGVKRDTVKVFVLDKEFTF